MPTQQNLYSEIIEKILAFTRENNITLPSWFCNEENDIVHPALCKSSPDIEGDWWSDKGPVTLNLTVSPEIRIEDEYYVLLVGEEIHTVTRISKGKRSAVTDPAKWINIALKAINAKDRYTVRITATIEPSRGGHTMFREIWSVSCLLIKN